MANGRARGRSVRFSDRPTIADAPLGYEQSTTTSTINSMAYHHLEDVTDDVRALHAQEPTTQTADGAASSPDARGTSTIGSFIRSSVQGIRSAADEKRRSRTSSVSHHAGTSMVPGVYQIMKQTHVTQVSTPIEAPRVSSPGQPPATPIRTPSKKSGQEFATVTPMEPRTVPTLKKSISIQSLGKHLRAKSRSLLGLRQNSEGAEVATAETVAQVKAHYHSRETRPEQRMLNQHKSLPALPVMAGNFISSPAANVGVRPRGRGASVASAPGGAISRLDSVAEDPNELDPRYDPYGKCNTLKSRRSGDPIVRRKPVRTSSQTVQTRALVKRDGSKRLFEQRAKESAATHRRTGSLAESLEERQAMLKRLASLGGMHPPNAVGSRSLQADDDVQAVSAQIHHSDQTPAQISASTKASRLGHTMPRAQRDLRKIQTLSDLRGGQVSPQMPSNEESRPLRRRTTLELVGLPAVPPIPARYRQWVAPLPQPLATKQSQNQALESQAIDIKSIEDHGEDRPLFTRATTVPPFASSGVRNASHGLSGIAWRPTQLYLDTRDGRYYVNGMGSLLSGLEEQREADAAAKAEAIAKPKKGPLIKPEDLTKSHKRLRGSSHGPIPMSAFSHDAFPSPNKPTFVDIRRASCGRAQLIDTTPASRQSTGTRRSSSALNSDLAAKLDASSKETASSTMATQYTSASVRSRETSGSRSRDAGYATVRSDAGMVPSHRSTIRGREAETPIPGAREGDGGVWPAHCASGQASLSVQRSKLSVASSIGTSSRQRIEAGQGGTHSVRKQRRPSTSASTRTDASYKTALERPSSRAS